MGNFIREMYGKCHKRDDSMHKRDVSMENFIREMYGKFHKRDEWEISFGLFFKAER